MHPLGGTGPLRAVYRAPARGWRPYAGGPDRLARALAAVWARSPGLARRERTRGRGDASRRSSGDQPELSSSARSITRSAARWCLEAMGVILRAGADLRLGRTAKMRRADLYAEASAP
jgi:hypothetical protein